MVRVLPACGAVGLFALAACSDGVSDHHDQVPLTTPLYEPSEGNLPVPNDLLFTDSLDRTLNIPVDDPADGSDPKVALNTLDGWSLGAPFAIEFTGVGVDASTVVAGVGVRFFEVETEGGPDPIDRRVTRVIRELNDQEYFLANDNITATPNNFWEIRPLVPLKPRTTYMIVLTDAILGADGRPIAPDSEYIVARSRNPYPEDHPFAELQSIVLSLEAAAEGHGIDRTSIVMAYHFTTQSVSAVLDIVSQLAHPDPGDLVEQAIIDDLCATGLVDCTSGTTPEIPGATISDVDFLGNSAEFLPLVGNVDWYTGSIEVPYFLSAAENPTVEGTTFDDSALTKPWSARYPFVGDSATNLTCYNSLPRPTGTEKAPLMITVPKKGLGGDELIRPPTGWPLTIYIHGITADRSVLILIAELFAVLPDYPDQPSTAPRAMVSMDLPLHGMQKDFPDFYGGGENPLFVGYKSGTTRERTFGMDLWNEDTNERVDTGDGIIDGSGAHIINLKNLAVSRDNLRQAVSDLLHLYGALGDLREELNDLWDVPEGEQSLDLSQISSMGHSLGGILSVPFLSTLPDEIPASLGMAGGGIAKLLDGSGSFGPDIEEGLLKEGVARGTPDFETFLWAAQTLIDTADPIHHIKRVVERGTPVHLVEVIGGGESGEPDGVVPNEVANAPLSGTEPLARVGGLESAHGTIGDEVNPVQAIIRFIDGTHSSMSWPGEDLGAGIEGRAFLEIVRQVMAFASDRGKLLTTFDEDLFQ